MWKLLLLVAICAIGAEARNLRAQSNPIHESVVEYCRKNGHEDKVDEAEPGVWEFAGCINVVLKDLQEELTEAMPNGVSAIKQVTQKYCTRAPRLKTCVHTLTSALAPCMLFVVKENITLVNTGLDEMIDFGCYNGGERLARFLGEGGVQCVQTQKSALDACNAGLTEAAKKELSDQAQCTEFDAYVTCLNRSLDQCSTTIAKEVITSAMARLRSHLPC